MKYCLRPYGYIALLVIVLSLSACGRQPVPDAVTTGSSFPLTVTDDLGNQIVLAAKPEKIVSLSLATDEILSAIANKKSILGISALATDKSYSNITDYAATIPYKFSGKDLEKIIRLKPDLVITANWTDARDLSRLREAGIPVYAFKLPDSIEDIRKLISTAGILTGNSAAAEKLLQSFNNRMQSVSEACAKRAGAAGPTALLTDNLFYVYGSKTLTAQLLDVAHIRNLADTIGVNKIENISKERIIAADPAIIFMSAYSASDSSNPAAIYISDKSFANVAAVKHKAVYVIPSQHLTAASQYIADGAEDIAKAAYPGIKL